jgi:general L-amino acid transport system permease protein
VSERPADSRGLATAVHAAPGALPVFGVPRWLRHSAVTLVAVLACVGALYALMSMLAAAQQARDIRGGFDFLWQPAGFRIAESLFAIEPEDAAWRAILAGLVNTLGVVACAIPLASVLGLVLGLLRMSRHPLLARLIPVLTVPIRNTPVLLQLFAWYGAMLALPGVRVAWNPLRDVFVSNRGLTMPSVHGGAIWLVAAFGAAGLGYLASKFMGARAGGDPGKNILRTTIIACGFSIAIVVALYVLGTPLPHVSKPVLQGFGMTGGLTISPEQLTLLCGLSVFHATYIADIVVSAVRSVPLAQWQAGQALGLSAAQNARWIVYPHAARAGVPPYTNQCVMLFKNTSLAVAIGYPDLMGVLGSVTAQTARALECLAIGVLLYLSIGFLAGALANRYNARINRFSSGGHGGTSLGDVQGADPFEWNQLSGSWSRLAVTVGTFAVLFLIGIPLLQWAIFDAVWSGSPTQCQNAVGACWVAVRENLNVLAFGTLDEPFRLRAGLATVALLFGVVPALARARSIRVCAFALLAGALIAGAVLEGVGISPAIPVTSWSGGMVTVILAVSAISCALPLALLLALARRSSATVLRVPATALIEGVRGVPLVTLLLLVVYLIPFLVGADWSSRKFALAWIALSLHTACMLAEVLRGGFQAVSEGQALAARALGLRERDILWQVVLPQAIRHSAGAAVGVVIGAIKDTSLVTVIGLFDIIGAAKTILADGTWRPFSIEIYAAIGAVYVISCVTLSHGASRFSRPRVHNLEN